MPTVLSKLRDILLMPEWSMPYNCYEVGHTWNPSCSQSAFDITSIVLKEGFLMYTGLYTLSLVAFNRKIDQRLIVETAKNIVVSSFFLFFNGYSMFRLFCLVRKLSGKLYYTLLSFIPAFVGSLIAIHIERPSKRLTLAIYCANVASECLYRLGVRKNFWEPIPYGETIVFSLSIAIISYILRKKGFGKDPISYILRLILERHETKRRPEANGDSKEADYAKNNVTSVQNCSYIKPLTFDRIVKARHLSCPHKNESCMQYVVKGLLRSFGFAYLGQCLLLSVSKPEKILKTSIVLRTIRNRKNINFGLFVGAFAGLFRFSNCFLRWMYNRNEDWHALVAGLISGLSMLFSPNSTIATYALWKCIESLFTLGVENNLIPYPNAIIKILYAASVNMIFYTGILEPGCLRTSYFSFIDRVTNHKLHLLNRNLLSVFGTDAHIGYEDYTPELKLEFCTQKFLSIYYVWLL